MYGLSLSRNGGFIRSAEIQRALANVTNDGPNGTTADRAFQFLCEIEHIEARGIKYANQDFDLLSGALNFLDAVAPAAAESLRSSARKGA